MKNIVINCRFPISLLALILLAGFIEPAWSQEVVLNCLITYEIKDGIYIDKGVDDGLRQSLVGTMQLENGDIVEFEVLHVTRKTALLRLANLSEDNDKIVGQSVELVFEKSAMDQYFELEKDESLEDANNGKFVPLLWPPQWSRGSPKNKNVSHGQINLRQTLQKDNEGFLDQSLTNFGFSGSLDKIEGSRWSFEWSGDVAYRSGDAYSNHPDYQEARLDMYLASFQHPIGEDGFFRFGRFLPRELPDIGYTDGIHGQIRRSEHWSFGIVAGFKPDRRNLDPSTDEPLVAAYTTFETGDRKSLNYSGTAGLLGSLYESNSDRLSMLFDQRLNVGSSFRVNSTAQVDFDVGSAMYQKGTRLTRLNVSATSRISPGLSLRAGVDHWERSDNEAERDLLAIEDEDFFETDYWRYWIGSDHDLFWNLKLTERVTFIESKEFDYDPKWSIGVTRTGLPFSPESTVTATAFNLNSQTLDGYGFRLSAYIPVMDNKLYFQPAAGFRMLEAEPQSQDLEVNYMSLRLNGKLSSNLTLYGGLTYTNGDEVDSKLINLGLRYAW